MLTLMKPMLDLVPVFLALWRTGAVPVVLDPGTPREQKLRSIDEIGPKALIAIPRAQIVPLLYPQSFRTVRHTVTTAHGRLLPGASLGRFARQPTPAATR